MAGRSKKGGAFERRFSERLSLWWTGDSEDAFWRASQSGGRATVRGRKGKSTAGHYGDIAATDDRGLPLMRLLVLELKKGYKDATVHHLLDKPATAADQFYEQWIAQAKASAALAGVPYWMVVHQRDRREPLVLLPADLSEALAREAGAGDTGCVFAPPVARLTLALPDDGTESVVVTTLDNFLTAVEPSHVLLVLNRLNRRKRGR